MAKIELQHVTKVYENGLEAVKDFQLTVEDKEFVIFVGPSGCGKSTTLRMIAGLEEITSGDLLIDGKRMNDVPASERDIAMVFQNYALYPHMTVRKNIAYSMHIRHEKKEVIDQKVQEVAKILGLEELLDRKPGQLSGGQKQRVAMGRAIVRNPKVFLMDEPLSNLDAKLRGQMRVEIASLYHKLNSTFIYVTHDQTEAMTLGTRIVVMRDGQIQQVDTPQRLFLYPANQFVAGFIGTPPMNFQKGVIRERDGRLMVAVDGGEVELTEAKAAKVKAAGAVGKVVVVGVRPEHVQIIEAGGKPVTGAEMPVTGLSAVSSVHAEGTVEVYEMLGSEAIVYIDVKDQPQKLVAKVDAALHLQPGQQVKVSFDRERIHLFDQESGVTITN